MFNKWILLLLLMISFNLEAKMEVTTIAYKNKGKIPIKYVMPKAGGSNISIPFEWRGAPPETKSFALLMDDPHPIARNWVHWLVINIPPSIISLDEDISGKMGEVNKQISELNNSFGNSGYDGPQPPPGTGDHPYVTTIYALTVEKLNLSTNTQREGFLKAIEGRVLDKAIVTGMFGR